MATTVPAERINQHASYEPSRESFLSPAVRRDPYRYFRYLRNEQPVLWVDALNAYLVSRYEDVAAIARDPQTFSSIAMRRQAPGKQAQDRGGMSVITSDPPEHTRLRNILQGEFRMRPLKQLAPRIEALVTELMDDIESRDHFDLVKDFTIPLPVTVIAELLDIDRARHDDFKFWSDCLIKILNDRSGPEWEIARAGIFDLIEFFSGVLDERAPESAGRDDILSVLLKAEREGRIQRREIISYAILLLTGGNETTTNLLGGIMIALLDNPEQLARLVDDPGLIANAVEEGLRFCSPVQGVYRRAMTDAEVGGVPIPAQSDVILLFGSANHDESKFDAPETFDVARHTGGHMGFGIGIHHCLGAHLGRLEARTALQRLVPRICRLRAEFAEINWNKNWFVRGPDSLPFGWI